MFFKQSCDPEIKPVFIFFTEIASFAQICIHVLHNLVQENFFLIDKRAIAGYISKRLMFCLFFCVSYLYRDQNVPSRKLGFTDTVKSLHYAMQKRFPTF